MADQSSKSELALVSTNVGILRPLTHELPGELSPLIEGANRLEKLLQTGGINHPTDRSAVEDTISEFRKVRNEIKSRADYLKKKGNEDPRALYALCAFSQDETEGELIAIGAIHGIPIGETRVFGKEDKKLTWVWAGQETMVKILEVLEFIRPGETISQRINRISGDPNPSSGSFVFDKETGANIPFDPKRRGVAEFEGCAWLDSPLMGPYTTLRVTVDMSRPGDEFVVKGDLIKEAKLDFDAPTQDVSEYQIFIGQTLRRFGQ